MWILTSKGTSALASSQFDITMVNVPLEVVVPSSTVAILLESHAILNQSEGAMTVGAFAAWVGVAVFSKPEYLLAGELGGWPGSRLW